MTFMKQNGGGVLDASGKPAVNSPANIEDLLMGRFFLNSLILSGFAVLGQVFVSAMVAYVFARLRAPGKNVLFVILLSTLMLPMEITLIPQFAMFAELGWLDTMLPLIVPNLSVGRTTSS